VSHRRRTCIAATATTIAVLGLTGVAVALPEGAISEFALPVAASRPAKIVAGSDGNLWFTEYETGKIGRITPAGAITEFPLPTEQARPEGIAQGPEGNFWFTERKGDKIGMITPAGAITEYGIPTPESEPEAIALGPDGNLWFTEYNADKIGRITPAGAITEFPLPSPESGPLGITAGPDGNVWFTEYETNQIGRITPSGSVIEFPLPTAKQGPWNIVSGPDGNLWFTEFKGNQIGRITPAGTVTEFPIPTAASFPTHIVAGPDGNIWFIEYGGNTVGRVTPAGTITEFQLPTAESDPDGLATGPDGSIWFAESTHNSIGRIGTGVAEPSVSAPQVTGGAQVGAPQTCSTSWTTWGSLQPSPTLFGFDGYRWLLNGAQIATGQSYTPTREQLGAQLSCSETVTYPLLDVTDSATSASVAVTLPPAPVISDIHQTASRWREGNALAHATGRSRKPPFGTTISFVLSEAASIDFEFRTIHAACRMKGHKRSHAKDCGRTTSAGKLSFEARAGANSVSFEGRISRARKLASSNYALILTATNSEGERSASESLRFTIVPGR
jgi:streptogramin lyase